MRRIRSPFAVLILSVFFAFIVGGMITVYAKTYSYNDLKLNYSMQSGLYGAGKNGYKFVIGTRNGNIFSYRKARVEYDDIAGHDVFSPYGEKHTAKLTSKTKYYMPIPWSKQSKMKIWTYKYGEKRFKKLRILNSVSKKTIFSKYSLFYIKIKNGKVTKMISPLIYAL